ncbi:AbrB/MazE/SpoVT family DNA-binding domain-containing protein [Paenibacillus melissococcoides]|uniref:AbrB/MazE/SpoVT family DNA-binding domain-containing protein n=1 Tax=Paenibacillus melissococcoides TaxID=2912268 RepID=A0ABN8U4R2_9BACL|nr:MULTISPECIES: AbrB/MazE/SpoVT family DNA-binding domain-containing protein [Paenibacillus]MEB9893246.1 AbrB/MazE/SpoVT family DNA-binding domain-containing protein [Bacillus cereus]CAH8246080.1 AbrB/MazE/SpoVT family DNA-binding domain-containing protein [Paenibacillus melissococcoides]CAH8712916.1 AbrB/MazE/SpoVT family DNA-binding domain-containing protein [Paenibacillus melissococcoides]CAH8713669.1 AbrB/MazE/SpoVT family DNA-binding domain-containing protein [Paenibacillus melissococcoid
MSKTTGIVRHIDNVGRIVIPAELRSTLGMPEGTAVSIESNGVSITVRKYAPSCTFCESLERMDSFKGKPVCQKCKAKIAEGEG